MPEPCNIFTLYLLAVCSVTSKQNYQNARASAKIRGLKKLGEISSQRTCGVGLMRAGVQDGESLCQRKNKNREDTKGG